MSALGRLRSFVTVRDFSTSATCYALLNGRDRPKAVVLDSSIDPGLFASLKPDYFKPFTYSDDPACTSCVDLA